MTDPVQVTDHAVKVEVGRELYPEHVIKEEMVIGPEVLRRTVLAAHSSSVTEARADSGHTDLHNRDEIKQEPSVQDRDDEEVTDLGQDTNCAAKEVVDRELYPDHVIKEEMVIGPEVFQRTLLEAQDTSEHSSPVRSHPRCNQQLSSHASGTRHSCEGGERAKHATSPARVKKYICDICTKLFNRRDSVVKHLCDHAGLKLFHCKICKKQFSLKHTLTTHERTHTGEKPFHCKICEKPFSRKDKLTQHGRTHSGEKPFHCSICDKQFSLKVTLTRHERTHSGEKPFHCKICKKPFSRKDKLTQHEHTHSGKKLFHCDICKKHFSWKSSLTQHKCNRT